MAPGENEFDTPALKSETEEVSRIRSSRKRSSVGL